MRGILILILLSLVAGCAMPPNSASVYNTYQAQGEQSVRTGVVESVRNVLINSAPSGVGTLGGAALGGLAGSTIGGGKGAIAAAIGGAIAGGLLGDRVEQGASNKPGLEITVKLDGGGLTAVTQDADEIFYVGDRVRLLSNGGVTRVTH